jgi:hypothetical protein
MMVGEGTRDVNINIPRDAYDTGKEVPIFNAYLIAIIRDSGGRIVKIHRQRSRSPTANFIGLMLPVIYFSNTNSSYNIVNTGNAGNAYQPGLSPSAWDISYPNPSSGNQTYLVMIQVGSGQQSNPYSAVSLASPIANGSGSGQLVYGQPSLPSNINVSGSSAYFTVSQTFNNQSGGTITITEVGIIVNVQVSRPYYEQSGSFGNVLVWYDVLSPSISIPNGGSLTIYYTFTVNP